MNGSRGNIERLLIEQLVHLLKETMKQILLYAQASMSESQFRAFRKLVLDAFGSKGLQSEILNAVSKVMDRAGAQARSEQGSGEL